jgi:SAM-dependent methyltransferase
MRIRNFNQAFRKGFQSYDTWMGDWWHNQSTNPPHRRAYRKISEFMHTFLLQSARHEPDFIVDYACGNGAVLKALVHRFPQTRFIALDGSKKMLNIAHHYLDGDSGLVPKEKAFHRDGPRIRLVHSPLPDFSLPSGKADAVLFLFPNMNFSAAEKKRLANIVYSDRTAVSIAKMLSLIPEDDELLTRRRSRELFENMLFDRAISLNIHGMLKPKAHWFKVEYSNVRREGLSKLDTVQTLFSESAWDVKIDGIKIRDRFQLVNSKYYRSSVVLDVYDQSQDPIDRTGGYFISSFRKR